MDNLHYRLTFDLDNKIWLKNVVMCGKYSLAKFANFLIIVLRAKIVTTFGSKMVTISARNANM